MATKSETVAIRSEEELAALAIKLVNKVTKVFASEIKLSGNANVTSELVDSTRALILAGEDPLGEMFVQLRSSEERRNNGATYTPPQIVEAMVAWAENQAVSPIRIVDAGAGSGRYTIAAAKRFPHASLVAVEIDPLAALLLRANAAVLGFIKRMTVEQTDYRRLSLPKVDGPTLFIGNPPYVRHHRISEEWKSWFAITAKKLGFKASKLAGLHVHFFLKTRAIASKGDFGAFITAAEWMDVNYGSVMRQMLANGLGGTSLHLIASEAMPFADAMTTGAITCFRVGERPEEFTMRSVKTVTDLSTLSEGRSVTWEDLNHARKWSPLIHARPVGLSADHIELGELFKVHRGQVSGKNAIWIESEAAQNLPERFLFPTVTRARDLIAAGDELISISSLKRVVDLPRDLDDLEGEDKKAVFAFLDWAKANGADQGWIATHRKAWWSVGLRIPAPILCTYMARRTPAFVRNTAGARHLNIAHGLYPIEPLSETVLQAVLQHLRATVNVSSGRTYAGGLVKFEPGEVERLHIPSPSTIAAMVRA